MKTKKLNEIVFIYSNPKYYHSAVDTRRNQFN